MRGYCAVLGLLALLSSVASGFLFQSSNPAVAHSEGRAVNESCLAQADLGSCDFYTCFENRLPCGRDWYILRSGHYYCNKLQRQRTSFSQQGQEFLDSAQTCLSRSLKEMYQRDMVDCHDLEHHAVAAISPCFTENGFCDVFNTDANNFYELYETRDLFSRRAAKVWRQIVRLAVQCGGDSVRQISENTRIRLAGVFNNFLDTLANRRND